MRKVHVLILIVLLFATGGVSHAEKVPVVTSIYPVMDLVRQVGEDRHHLITRLWLRIAEEDSD
ncbi:MAG TPA: hypothetical protein VFG09_14955 [Thermodesulfovibrionales bacterium]|jgi:ABC-type Zn uptake system ZnuABC Zn-binding protein ZnuA|nr:hypothetical protein [Thermodesulfovibrionales bacterium]